MAFDNEDKIPYGILNPVDTMYGPAKGIFNTDNQPFSKTLTEIAKDRFSRDILAGATEYTAICLCEVPPDFPKDNTEQSVNFFGVPVQSNAQRRVFARIPELHAHLPIPENERDYDIIRMYPIFVGEAELESPSTGDLIKVTFKNVYNQQGPIYLGLQFSGNKGVENKSNASLSEQTGHSSNPSGSINRYVANPLTPSDPNYNEKLKESMKSVYHPYGNEAKNGLKPNIENKIEYRGSVFKESKRDKSILNSIIIHEALNDSVDSVQNGLKNRGTGVHFLIDPFGKIYGYNDPKNQVYHAEYMNTRSIGIEMCKIVHAVAMKPNDDRDTVPAKWVHPGSTEFNPKQDNRYCVPRLKMLESAFELIKYLCLTYNIPIAFPSIKNNQFIWGLSMAISTSAGIASHQHCGSSSGGHHSDGSYFEYYILGRFNNLNPKEAYDATLKAANQTKRNGLSNIPGK